MSKKSKEPTGKERMLRKRPTDFNLMPKHFEFDIKKAYSQEQLAEIGAVALAWNQVEAHIEFITLVMLQGFFSSLTVCLKILEKIKTVKDKIDILRKCSEESNILDNEAKKCIKSALDAVIEYKTYRNAIVHSMIFDHEKGIATFVDHRSKPWQILLTKDALLTLYNGLIFLRNELIEIDLLYRMSEGKVIVNHPKTKLPERDQVKALRERIIPEQTAKVLLHQNKRKSLSPLPQFPDAHLINKKI